MKKLSGLLPLLLACFTSFSQVDTSYIFKTGMPYGTLDIRIAKSATRYYYLDEDKTISFRESAPGVKTNTYVDMTTWDSSPYRQGNLREKNGSSDTFIMNYRMMMPNNYNESYSPGYPLMLFMHGAGERGNCWDDNCYHSDRNWTPITNTPPAPTDPASRLLNNDHNLLHGGQVYLDARNLAGTMLPNDPGLPARAFPGFVLVPQNLNGWTSTQDAIKLVRLVAKKYNIDENRIYITGLSNGGQAVYDVLKHAPWLFAAALPMSATGDAGLISQGLTSTVAHIPFWIFQGGKDSSPSPAVTESRVKALREAGAEVRYTNYANLGHGTWNSAFKEKDYFTWILGFDKSNIHFYGGSAFICQSNGQGARMELAAGFRAYQWELNGEIISDATGNTYTATVPGVYRARFSRVANPSETDWNKWSQPINVQPKDPAPAIVKQTGTVMLRDLNGNPNASLSTTTIASHFYWFKDSVQFDLPDTTRYVTFTPGDCTSGCTGNGAYTLITRGYDGCPTPPSLAKNIFFEDQAPVNITAPISLTGTVISQSSLKVSWLDKSNNETGFEVWRRRVINGTTNSPWELAGMVSANVKSFTSLKLIPSTTYHFKIRAINNTGRSEYEPIAPDSYLALTTMVNTSPPTIPSNLKAAQTAINTIKLTWSASTDNSGIKQYRIYYGSQTVLTNTPVTSLTLSNLTLNTIYSFTIQAEDIGGNLSTMSSAVSGSTYVTGLYYEHSTGAWFDLDEINWNNKEFQGKISSFSIGPRTQQDYFNFRFEGYLYINTGGTYEFQTTSSDGSRIDLEGVTILDNDGVHASVTMTSAPQVLTAGPKKIVVKYFELDESHVLTVRYKGPDTGNAWKTVPSSALKSGDVPSGGGGELTAMEVESSALSVFPNPANQNNIRVQMEMDATQPALVRMMDFSGREVYRKNFTGQEIIQGVSLQPEQVLRDGLYFVFVHQKEKAHYRKIRLSN
jgi:hypothetical protein